MEQYTRKMYAVLGPSGYGKTTLLSLLGGLDCPTGGSILLVGKDIERQGWGVIAKNTFFLFFQAIT